MMLRRFPTRTAAILPLTAVSIVVLLGFVALSIDIGMLMIVRNQCQNAADAAAMAGARTLTGDTATDNNSANVRPNAVAAASTNPILNRTLDPATQLTVTIGDYYYDSAARTFKSLPNSRLPGNPWTLVQATVTSQMPTPFGKLFGINSFDARAVATAAHRPRDTSIVIDFSGSMRFDSLLASPYNGDRTKSMNPDSEYPTFGHYAGNANFLTYQGDVQAAGGELMGKSNTAVPTKAALDSVISKFYSDSTAFGTSTPAFSKASPSYANTPAGDMPLRANKGTTSAAFARNLSEHIFNNSTTITRDWRYELDGYSAYVNGGNNPNTTSKPDYNQAPFYGYTQGPGYWGKTFFTWPPDPRVPLTTQYYTGAQIQSMVRTFLLNFGYSTADFNNTSVSTTLSANVTTAATTVVVNSSTPFPAAPFQVMVGTVSSGVFQTTSSIEIMNVTAVSGNTLTVQRARNGTTASAFTAGQTVGLLTAPPLIGLYTAANTTLTPRGVTPAGSNLWTGWTSTTLSAYVQANVYRPANKARLTTTDDIFNSIMRLLNRNGGPGMPKNGAGLPVAADWRARFFQTKTGAPLMDNSKLYDTTGLIFYPRFDSYNDNYRINYDAILDWIKNSGPNPFPNRLQSGGIVYYTAIPSTIDLSTFPPTDPNQRFWKEYIDEVLGFQQTDGPGATVAYYDVSRKAGYGVDFTWGTPLINGQPTGWPTTTYMNYSDNPNRPKLRTWFGPLSLIDFIGNYNANNGDGRLWWPGTVPETPTYQTKLAIQAALKDTIRNHPNDNISLIFFSSPKGSATSQGYYNTARAPMGRDIRRAINSLWFSPKMIATQQEISVYDATGKNPGDINDVPRANGGTCYAMPLMLAYNQFSSNPSLVSYTQNADAGTAGGLGRNGASKLLIFETDGMVNIGADATMVSSTSGQGYYRVRVPDANNLAATGTEFPTGVGEVVFSQGVSQCQMIAQQICNDVSAGGFSTARKPVKIHCIAFGSLFEPNNNSAAKNAALANLAQLEVIGSVQPNGATTLPANKIIIGDYNTRITSLQSALSRIMQDGVQVTLISSGSGKP